MATVTLEDKGLVELTVSFGQAEYEIREGQEADIEGSSPDLCVKAEEAPRLRLGCLGDLLFLEE